MAYLVFKYDLNERLNAILYDIGNTKYLGRQLCMLFELLLVRICMLPSFQSRYDITASAGMNLPINHLFGYFEELSIPIEIVRPLEEFRNAYVHNGVPIVFPLYRELVRQDKVIELIQLSNELGVTLDFTLDL